MAKAPKANTYPSLLAFERKISPSDGVMFFVRGEDELSDKSLHPIVVRTKSLLGTKSSESVSASKKGDDPYAEGNPQTVDVASLPMTESRLAVRFTVRFLSDFGIPSSCNNEDFASDLKKAAFNYVNAPHDPILNLAVRYALAIANGRFLFRNKINATRMSIVCDIMNGDNEVERTLVFKDNNGGVNTYALSDALSGASQDILSLAGVIKKGLIGEGGIGSTLRVTGFVTLADGQEVFPSQEMTIDKDNSPGAKSKTLYTLSYKDMDGVAGLHSQKIGNALRTIDDGYAGVDASVPVIAVEPYGAVVKRGIAYRKGGNSFYKLFGNFIARYKDGAPDTLATDPYVFGDDDFVVACLIRGGVYSGTPAAKKENTTKKDNAAPEDGAAPEGDAE